MAEALIQLNANWRVADDPPQWSLQYRKGNPRGRTSGWVGSKFIRDREHLLERIVDGARLRKACEQDDALPDRRTVLRWLGATGVGRSGTIRLRARNYQEGMNMTEQRDERGRFRKGMSGNPGGRPRSALGFREACRELAPKALKVLEEIMGELRDK